MDKLLGEIEEAKKKLESEGASSEINATIASGRLISLTNQFLAESLVTNTQKIIVSNKKLAEKGTYLSWALFFVAGVQALAAIVPYMTSLLTYLRRILL